MREEHKTIFIGGKLGYLSGKRIHKGSRTEEIAPTQGGSHSGDQGYQSN